MLNVRMIVLLLPACAMCACSKADTAATSGGLSASASPNMDDPFAGGPAALLPMMKDIRLTNDINTRGAKMITVESFQGIIAGSRYLPEGSSELAGWSFAPAYTGSFKSGPRRYRFDLYFGGLGKITAVDGSARFFRFDAAMIK